MLGLIKLDLYKSNERVDETAKISHIQVGVHWGIE